MRSILTIVAAALLALAIGGCADCCKKEDKAKAGCSCCSKDGAQSHQH